MRQDPWTKPNPPPRQGPRPLPIHLLSNAATLLTSCAALPHLKTGSLHWKEGLAPAAAALAGEVERAGPDAWQHFAGAVITEATRRHKNFLDGISRYRRNGYHREAPTYPATWAEGTTRLWDCRAYWGNWDHPTLLVPSLINRSYILDLSPRTSVARGLARRGLSPFLLDWDAPGPEEMVFDTTDYITKRLIPAIKALRAKAQRPVTLVGYCMGGLLALAAALKCPDDVADVVLMATPWDFHSGLDAPRVMLETLAEIITHTIETMGQVPVDLLQCFISTVDPHLTSRKFTAFASLAPQSPRAREFVMVEDWVNDGVPLAPKVALECFHGWYGRNDTLHGRWKIDGDVVDPTRLHCPALMIIPDRDKIVTPASAHVLGHYLPQASVIHINGGHVGMLLSRYVGSTLHAPMARWIKSHPKRHLAFRAGRK